MFRNLLLGTCLMLAACSQPNPVDRAAIANEGTLEEAAAGLNDAINAEEAKNPQPAPQQDAGYHISGLVDSKQWNGPERIVVLIPDENDDQSVGGSGLLVAYLVAPSVADYITVGKEASLQCQEAGTTPDGIEYHGCHL